jgi:hypothetical protein
MIGMETQGPDLGGYVAFAAAQSDEETPEQKLPYDQKEQRWHGLFTYTFAEVLSQGDSVTYEQAAARIFDRYRALNRYSPTPFLEGTHLGSPLFNMNTGPRLRQWPIIKKQNILSIQAGQLHQIAEGSIFSIVPEPGAHDDSALGFLRVRTSNIDRSELEPVSHANKPPLSLGDVPNHSHARLVEPKLNMTLRVALPAPAQPKSDYERRAETVLQSMANKKRADGIQITWVDPGDADIRLVIESDDIWLLPRTAELIKAGPLRSMSISVKRNSSELEQILDDGFQTIAKVLNLSRLVDAMAGGRMASQLRMSLYVTRARSENKQPLNDHSIEELHAGDALYFEIENTAPLPVNVTLLFIDSQHGIRPIYPKLGLSNRIERRLSIPLGSIDTETVGIERVLAIAVESPSNSPQIDFSFLAQKRLPKERTAALASLGRGDYRLAITDLFVESGFGKAASLNVTRSRPPGNRLAMKFFTWKVTQ